MFLKKEIAALLSTVFLFCTVYANELCCENQDFDDMPIGTDFSSNSTLKVVKTTPDSDIFEISELEGNKVLHFKHWGDQATYPEMSYSWNLPSKRFTCVRFDINLKTFGSGALGFWVIDKKKLELPIPLLVNGEQLGFNWGGGNFEKVGSKLNKDVWYTVAVFADVPNQKFHLYLFERGNSTELFSCSRSFRSKVNDIGVLHIKHQDSSDFDVYVDNISVTSSDSTEKALGAVISPISAGKNKLTVFGEQFNQIFGINEKEENDPEVDGTRVFCYDCDDNKIGTWINATAAITSGIGGRDGSNKSAFVSLNPDKYDGFIQYSHIVNGVETELTSDFSGIYVIDFKFFPGAGFDESSAVRISTNQGRLVSPEIKITSTGYMPGKWNRVRVIYDTANAKTGYKGKKTTYLNGCLVDGPTDWNINADLNCLRIGVTGKNGTQNIAYMDDIAIYMTQTAPDMQQIKEDDQLSEIPEFESGLFVTPIVVVYSDGAASAVYTKALNIYNPYRGLFDTIEYEIDSEMLDNTDVSVKAFMWKSPLLRVNLLNPFSVEEGGAN